MARWAGMLRAVSTSPLSRSNGNCGSARRSVQNVHQRLKAMDRLMLLMEQALSIRSAQDSQEEARVWKLRLRKHRNILQLCREEIMERVLAENGAAQVEDGPLCAADPLC